MRVDALDRLGLTDSTLVIYAGDHGYLLGHHGRFEKHMMWEEAVRAPLIMKNAPRLGAGRTTDALVEFIDLVPTILDVLGAPALETVQGRSEIRAMTMCRGGVQAQQATQSMYSSNYSSSSSALSGI